VDKSRVNLGMGASKRKSSKKVGASIIGAFREKDNFNPMLAADGGPAKKPKKMRGGGNVGGPLKMKDGGFPDLSGDGRVTQKDILMGKGVIKRNMGGKVSKKSGVIKGMRSGGPLKKGK